MININRIGLFLAIVMLLPPAASASTNSYGACTNVPSVRFWKTYPYLAKIDYTKIRSEEEGLDELLWRVDDLPQADQDSLTRQGAIVVNRVCQHLKRAERKRLNDYIIR
jgi:hypothetical protein